MWQRNTQWVIREADIIKIWKPEAGYGHFNPVVWLIGMNCQYSTREINLLLAATYAPTVILEFTNSQ